MYARWLALELNSTARFSNGERRRECREREQLVSITVRELNLNWQGTTLFIDKSRTRFLKGKQNGLFHWRIVRLHTLPRLRRFAVDSPLCIAVHQNEAGEQYGQRNGNMDRRAAVWPEERQYDPMCLPEAPAKSQRRIPARQCLRMSIATIDDKLIERVQYAVRCRGGERAYAENSNATCQYASELWSMLAVQPYRKSAHYYTEYYTM